IGELAALLECDGLDIEFAVDRDGTLYLLQVRPLVTGTASPLGDAAIDGAVAEIACKVELLSRSHPYLHGTRAVFGVMPDWNPAERLVNYYLDRLRSEPNLHDKVEFEIVFSCYTLDLPERIRTLEAHGFSNGDIEALVEALHQLTNRIMNGPTALWRQDRDKI